MAVLSCDKVQDPLERVSGEPGLFVQVNDPVTVAESVDPLLQAVLKGTGFVQGAIGRHIAVWN